jgi:hypothetical protein
MQPQRARDDPPPALGGLGLGRKVEVGAPQRDVARVLEDGTLKDAKGARVAGVRARRADVEAPAALGAQPVQRPLPVDVGEEVGGLGAWGEDQVLVVGALGYEGADFILGERGGG